MKPADTDPFPRRIEILRGRRRTVELYLEQGRLVARVPESAGGPRLDAMLRDLRVDLWDRLRRRSVFDDAGLTELARDVAAAHLADQALPPWTVRFSRRQHRRWGSCTVERGRGRIRISAHLIGHPRWLIAHILLHELVHLVVPDHGPRFQDLMQRSPDRERGRGYLEALETLERNGPRIQVRLPEDSPGQAELFAGG